LNPDGDLLAIMMIETADGLKNADAIASVPGVGRVETCTSIWESTATRRRWGKRSRRS
jgi:hypothetical protein